MADAYTTNNNITKPEYNADEDTWGTLLNANFDAIDPQITATIFGLTLSTAGSSATFAIAAGGASGMVLASAFTKTTSAWSLGTGGGGLDAGTIATSTWYHVYLIERPDTHVVDGLVSANPTTPAMPANYTRKRRIGAMLTDGSSKWTKFLQYGDEFLWDVPVRNYNGVTGSGSAAALTLTVPSGLKVGALVQLWAWYVGPGGGSASFYSPDQSDAGSYLGLHVEPDSTYATQQTTIRTGTSSQIRGNVQAAAKYYVSTLGWIDPRGKW